MLRQKSKLLSDPESRELGRIALLWVQMFFREHFGFIVFLFLFGLQLVVSFLSDIDLGQRTLVPGFETKVQQPRTPDFKQ